MVSGWKVTNFLQLTHTAGREGECYSNRVEIRVGVVVGVSVGELESWLG